ncbi:unnamed protein product, partial [Mesorhabditis spiculigera]
MSGFLAPPGFGSAPGEASTSDLPGLVEPHNISIQQLTTRTKSLCSPSTGGRFMYHVVRRSSYALFFALIGIFVNRVRHWSGDMLHSISSRNLHAHFLFRKPLILCIVSKRREQLAAQLDVLFDQIVSTISRKQLEGVYEKRGDNYDLRRLLQGTDKYMDSCLESWQTDLSQISCAIRVFPLPAPERDFLSTTIATTITAAAPEGVLFGIVLAHRQLVSMVRYKKYTINPKDLHILINFVSNNSTISVCPIWTPICLPYFNDNGFLHAYISSLWEGSAAYLLLLSVDRNAFNTLNTIKEGITEKLKANTKLFPGIESAINTQQMFQISNIGAGSDAMWNFLYKNRSSQQVCLSALRPPIANDEERQHIVRTVGRLYGVLKSVEGTRVIYMRRKRDVLLVRAENSYDLQCVLSPFCTPANAWILGDKLLKALKTHEGKHFITHTLSF